MPDLLDVNQFMALVLGLAVLYIVYNIYLDLSSKNCDNFRSVPNRSGYVSVPNRSGYISVPNRSGYTSVPNRSGYTSVPNRSGFHPASINAGHYGNNSFKYGGGGLGKLTPGIVNQRFGGGHIKRPHGGWNNVGSWGFPYSGSSYPAAYYIRDDDTIFNDDGVPFQMTQFDSWDTIPKAGMDPEALVKASTPVEPWHRSNAPFSI